MTDTMILTRSRGSASGSSVGAPASSAFARARLLALLLPAALLAGAWTSQLWGGLFPCEMCHWQRWPHYAALPLAALAFALPRRSLVALAAFAIAVSGGLGVWHAGVEWHLLPGPAACTTTFLSNGLSTDQLLKQIMAAPVVQCNTAQWRLFGVSLAGWNALFSLGGAGLIAALLRRSARA